MAFNLLFELQDNGNESKSLTLGLGLSMMKDRVERLTRYVVLYKAKTR
ncbi:hypothetical protein I6G82_18160 [Lysinibacillus macroides]|nr:hypothetical protein [Lysinibacillus macroides]QPR67142.1 hypothetical protein I6G82_18160 [Lysinibacillus macroides]